MDAGVPIKRAGRRHRDGPDQGGRRLHRALRHRRRRGPPRRHGLQGRRHVRGHHRPPDGHQDHGRHASTSCATRSSRPRPAATHILGKMAEVDHRAARGALAVRSAHQPRSRSTPTRSAWSSARAARRSARCPRSSTPQIDVDDDGTILVYAPSGEQGDALVDRIRSMTKEVEVGDEFTGKVVKTTTFGAFVELTKGTDGLLHISNVKPGERVETRRGRARPRPGDRGPRGRGRPRARPHRPASAPTIPTSPARPPRSSPASAPATRAARGGGGGAAAATAVAAAADRGGRGGGVTAAAPRPPITRTRAERSTSTRSPSSTPAFAS